MKVKKLFLFAAAAAMFAACSSDDLTQQAAEQTPQDNGAISFDAYMQRPVTRAGATGPVTTDSLTKKDEPGPGPAEYLAYHYKAGFGVFAYYTDNFDYTPLYQPNFMYNEQVKWDAAAPAGFKYALTKYWPNEHGSAAKSTDQDRVSFFAYLPWVDTDPATGMLKDVDVSDPTKQWGIMGMKRNSLQGDPIIQYITSFDQNESVDLCWGTTGSTNVTWSTNSTTQTIAAGKPWLNVRKPDGVGSSDDSKVYFTFRHATAKLKVTVQTDNTSDWKATDDAAATKVWIRSIRFTGMAKKAALNLNNPVANKARWIDYYGTNELEMGESVTVYDGRKDGSEGVAGAESVNETVLGLNPQLIQDENQLTSTGWRADGATKRTGVPSASSANLFCAGSGAATEAVYVIPTGEKVDVEIVYDIETIDNKLPVYLSDGETHGSTIENRIYKQAVFTKLESGKSYVLNLKLGMKDVKFNATVNDDWEADTQDDVYLPSNVPSYAFTTATGSTLEIPGAATSFNFVVTNLKSGEGVTASSTITSTTPTVGSAFDGSDSKASAGGNAYIKVSDVTANTTIKNIEHTDAVTVTPDITTGGPFILKVIQKAEALGLTQPSTLTSTTTYTLRRKAGSTYEVWSSANTNCPTLKGYPSTEGNNYIRVWLNGTELVYDESTASDGKFTFDNSVGKITLNAAPAVGTEIKVTIKAGDVQEETITFKIS
jgi:hypothetical protein